MNTSTGERLKMVTLALGQAVQDADWAACDTYLAERARLIQKMIDSNFGNDAVIREIQLLESNVIGEAKNKLDGFAKQMRQVQSRSKATKAYLKPADSRNLDRSG